MVPEFDPEVTLLLDRGDGTPPDPGDVVYGSSRTWWTEDVVDVEYCVMAELAEQVDLRTLASALDFSTAHFVI